MDIQWGTFLSGVVIGATGAFFTGFMSKAGEDAWAALKVTLGFADPQPIQVPANFNPNQHEEGNFSWVPEADVHDREVAGYTHFLHPNKRARCYRQLPNRKEFLMRQPNQH